ncbi:hypothetical protein [Merismopedia glauca]|uniref:Uncharacterized protein n=1 Tax=Merismopedia glauca CCAP 1448/3 TaxID=1296344 RepID=A0A2T1C4X9_9CYAN|nr:hypothetical protein [Merismopedia glauca]PSB03342.1 hypothetical protein C7B64_08785 [Merismopedia glauca CCAP 1448/3]
MDGNYTTEQLIQILAAERLACLKGKRLNLTVRPSGNALVDKFIKPDAMQKFSAYQDFRAVVHQYQEENQVSGIVWQNFIYQGKNLFFPQVHEQLIALKKDLETIKAAKDSIFNFWQEITERMDLYLSINSGKNYHKLETEIVRAIALNTIEIPISQKIEWANLSQSGSEIILQLGWGQPERAAYKQGLPSSGSEYIHAVQPGSYPLG